MVYLTDKVWIEESNRRWGIVAQYFKQKENMIIADFIRTAGELQEKEERSVV